MLFIDAELQWIKKKKDFAFTNKPNLKKELLSYMKGERVLNGRGKGLAI